MACSSCRQKKKVNLVYVKSLAIKAAIINQVDYQIYTIILGLIGQVYEFELINPNRTTVVEYIRYKDL